MLTPRLPALYLGHGAPPLADDPLWPIQLNDWAKSLPKPKEILIVSAHWEEAPLTIGATERVPLVYDFYGFPRRYYEVTYPSPGAPELATKVTNLVKDLTPTAHDRLRGLDHGAYVPLLAMYPDADIPVLQVSMPSQDPRVLVEIGKRLSPLRDEGVLILGSGFLTHSFEAIRMSMLTGHDAPPSWIAEFDHWAAEALGNRDIDSLLDYRRTAPAVTLAHPTVDHFIPLFIALGASLDDGATSTTKIDGFWNANSKRSIEFSPESASAAIAD